MNDEYDNGIARVSPVAPIEMITETEREIERRVDELMASENVFETAKRLIVRALVMEEEKCKAANKKMNLPGYGALMKQWLEMEGLSMGVDKEIPIELPEGTEAALQKIIRERASTNLKSRQGQDLAALVTKLGEFKELKELQAKLKEIDLIQKTQALSQDIPIKTRAQVEAENNEE